MTPIRVLVADDHALLRAALCSLLARLGGIEVVGEAADGPETLALVAQYRPDVLLTDLAIPTLDGLELAARVVADYPTTRVILLSVHLEREYVRKAIRIGVSGYLLTGSDVTELDLAIRAAARGECYLSPAVSTQLLADYQRYARGEVEVDQPLTPRQREVLGLIVKGKTTKAIARALGVSIKTVETHRTQLMDRLKIHDIAGLVRYAIRCELANPNELSPPSERCST